MAPDDEYAEPINLREVLLVLRRNVWLALGVALTVFLVGLVIVLRQTPEYRAWAVIRLEDERSVMTTGLSAAAAENITGRLENPLLSQLEVLRSRSVVAPVVGDLGLRLRPRDPALRPSIVQDVTIPDPERSGVLGLEFAQQGFVVSGDGDRIRGTYGAPVAIGGVGFTIMQRPETREAEMGVLTRLEAVDWLLGRMNASVRDKTNVVDVTFKSGDPVLAAQVANALVEEFQRFSERSAQEQARRRRIFMEEQLAQTDSALARAQLALTRFREDAQLFSTRELLAAQQAGLMELQIRREELAVDRSIYRSLLEQLSEAEQGDHGIQTLVSAPAMATNPVIASLYQQLVRYESALDSITAGDWGSAPSNPDVQRLTSLAAGARENLASAIESQVAALNARIAALDDLRQRNARELASLPPTEAEEARLVQLLETTRLMADQLREEYQRARIAEAVEAGQVQILDRAAVPTRPIGVSKQVKLALALILGLLIGAAVAFLREQTNKSLRGKDDVERTLRIPGLAVIPQILSTSPRRRLLPYSLTKWLQPPERNGKTRARMLIADTARQSGGAEAYRTLRTNLLFSQTTRPFGRIVITSTSPGEGKTTTAANVAITFAQQDMRVLLMECDLRRPQIHAAFDLEREPGLTNILLGQMEPDDVIRQTRVEGLDVVTCGALPPNPAELLGGPRMREVLEHYGAAYDLVLIDSPPLLGASDAAVLGADADGVLLVVRAGATERGAARAAMQQLHNVDARVLGAVLNDPDAKVPGYGGHFYYEYYGAVETA